MFFAFGDSNKKGVVAKPTHISEGSTKYIFNDGALANRQEPATGKGVRHLFRFDGNNKRSAAARKRRLKDIKEGDTVVLEFGGDNCRYDWKSISEAPDANHTPLMSLADFRALYEEMVSQIRALGANPILLSLPVLLPQRYFDYVTRGLNKANVLKWLGGDVNTLSNRHEQYNREVFKLGAELNVPVIDISTVFLDRRSLGDCYSLDGMHPNKRGYAMIAESVLSSGLVS